MISFIGTYMFLGNYTYMMWSSISMMSSSSVKISSVTFKDLLKNVRFNESHSRPLFLHFRLFFKQLTGTIGSIKVTDNWIQTADLWCRKRPLCQLCRNHCPLTKFLLTSCFCSCLKYSDIFFSELSSFSLFDLSLTCFGQKNFLSLGKVWPEKNRQMSTNVA